MLFINSIKYESGMGRVFHMKGGGGDGGRHIKKEIISNLVLFYNKLNIHRIVTIY